MKSSARIVSLLPSATEIVVSLGLQEQLVGRSHECDFPPEIEFLPVLTGPKFSSDGTSGGIDTEVSKLVERGLSVYWIDTEKLNELKPDVIITQSQCEICAVSMKDVEQAVCEVLSSNPQIINLQPLGFNELFTDFLEAGKVLGREKEAARLVSSIQQGIDDLGKAAPTTAKKKVGTIEWLDPLMNAGNWVPTLIEKVGGINLIGQDSEHSHYINFDDLADADITLIMPCGFSMEQSLRELSRLRLGEDWKRFIQDNAVYVCDGNHFFNRPGPRILESAQIVAEILHPDHYRFGHEGQAWVRLTPDGSRRYRSLPL